MRASIRPCDFMTKPVCYQGELRRVMWITVGGYVGARYLPGNFVPEYRQRLFEECSSRGRGSLMEGSWPWQTGVSATGSAAEDSGLPDGTPDRVPSNFGFGFDSGFGIVFGFVVKHSRGPSTLLRAGRGTQRIPGCLRGLVFRRA